MGFAPIKWTCTVFFRPRQLTDRAILANRQPQEKKEGVLLGCSLAGFVVCGFASVAWLGILPKVACHGDDGR